MWYPNIPDPDLCLNEVSYVAEDTYSIYRPIIWTHWGGPSGSLLKHVCGLTLATDEDGSWGIQFHYDSAHHSPKSPWLGRHNVTRQEDTIFFEIDGVGGERIDKIQYSLCTEHRGETLDYECLTSVMVSGDLLL